MPLQEIDIGDPDALEQHLERHGVRVGDIDHTGGSNIREQVHISRDVVEIAAEERDPGVVKHVVAHELAHDLDRDPQVASEVIDNEGGIWGEWNPEIQRFTGRFVPFAPPLEQFVDATARYVQDPDEFRREHPDAAGYIENVEQRHPDEFKRIEHRIDSMFGSLGGRP